MKRIAFAALALAATAATAADLTVEIDGVTAARGHLAVGLYDSAANFPSERGGAQAQRVASAVGRTTVVFRNLAPGNYAVGVYQDENDNQKLDKGMFGIPKEPYGFSNDARGTAGPPEFRDARFAVGEAPVAVTVRVR